jgi:uncharacterized protein
MSVYFEIQVDDINRAEKFYKEVFEWNFKKIPGLPIDYYHIDTTDGTMGGMLHRPMPKPADGQGTNAFVCSFQVANFDASQKKILDNGGRVALPKFAVPKTCWQGYFIDPEGNTFGLFEVDENAQ